MLNCKAIELSGVSADTGPRSVARSTLGFTEFGSSTLSPCLIGAVIRLRIGAATDGVCVVPKRIENVSESRERRREKSMKQQFALLDDTLIDGRLVDANQRAVANTPVQLVDEKNQPVAGATVTTDASGYYAIVLTPEAATALKDKKLFVAVGIGAEAKVPKASQPISVVPGGRVLQQVDLQPGEIARVGTKIDLGSILKTSGTASTGTVSTGTASPKTPAPSLSPKGAASKPKAKAPATKKATTRKKPSSR